MTNTKANLARGIVSREARIVPRPVAIDDGTLTELGAIEWGQFTDTPATELLEAQSDEMQDERSEIEAIVLDYLEACGGSAPAGEVLKVTRAAGLNDNAVKKARKKIGVKTERQGFGKGAKWVWAIDAAIGAIDSHARERESMESMRESMTSSTPTSELESTKTGRAIRANTPLGVNNSGPTGDMQGKHDGPTGQKSQSGHGPHTGPTGQLFTLNTSTTPQPNDLEDAVLNALDTTRGQTTKQIQKHLTKQQLDQADDFYTVIERLQMKGLIRINERGLFVRKETA